MKYYAQIWRKTTDSIFCKIIKSQNLSNMHISDISTIELHNKHFLTWKMQEVLSVQ